MTGGSSKQCVVCGQDRTGQPRVKDPKGRYYCPDCYEQALQRKQQANVAPAQQSELAIDASDDTSEETAVDEVVDQPENAEPSLLDEAVEEIAPAVAKQQMEPCENCGQPTPVGYIICTSCGYDRHTGQTIKIQTGKTKTDWASDTGIFLTPGVAGGGMMAVFGILFFIGRTVEPAAMALFLLTGFYALGVSIAALFFAFRESAGKGLLTLLVPFYVLWFVYAEHPGLYLKWLYGALIVGAGCSGAMLSILGIDALPLGS